MVYWKVEDCMKRHVSKDVYTPELMGFRPLKNGRLALQFYNVQTEKEEVRVVDIWKEYANYKGVELLGDFFDPKVFMRVFYCNYCIVFSGGLELLPSDLYGMSELVQEDFIKLV